MTTAVRSATFRAKQTNGDIINDTVMESLRLGKTSKSIESNHWSLITNIH